jgi:uncharacterized protein involved in cysteine biosynthesis
LGTSTAGAGDWRLSWRNTLGPWLGAALVVPVFLLVPFVGGPLLAAFLAYLNVRTLVNDGFEGIADVAEVRTFVATHRWQMLLLGVLLALLALVPLVGFLLPWVTGSAVCHLVLLSQRDSGSLRGRPATGAQHDGPSVATSTTDPGREME